MTDVPSQYQQQVNTAAAQLGIPASVVAAQLYLESGWNPNAVSPTGAQGLAQFEPGTWAQYGSGSPFDPSNAFAAYVKYMAALLKQEGGDVRKALEAYNAGPGNLGAGSGYASTILANAGAGDIAAGASSVPAPSSNAPGGGGGWTSALGGFFGDLTGGLFSWPGQIIGTLEDLDKITAKVYSSFLLFFKPSTYVRIGAGLAGFMFMILGVVCLAREAKDA